MIEYFLLQVINSFRLKLIFVSFFGNFTGKIISEICEFSNLLIQISYLVSLEINLIIKLSNSFFITTPMKICQENSHQYRPNYNHCRFSRNVKELVIQYT